MRTTAFVALLLAVAVAACGPSAAGEQADAAVDAADDAAAVDGPQADAASWGTTGARLIHARMMRPWGAIACDPNPCNAPSLPAAIVLRARAAADGVELRVGMAGSVTDGGVALDYGDNLTPAVVLAEVGQPYDGASGPRRPFVTVTPASWLLPLVPAQPYLPIRNATFGGSLDAQGVPTSNDPALGGTITGCFTRDDAGRVYLPSLSQNLLQLIESSGGAIDVDCGGSGGFDGYRFEAQFEGVAVEVREPQGLDGGPWDHDGG